MLEYLIDLTQIGLLKCQGLSIQQNPAVDRLIENRTVSNLLLPLDCYWLMIYAKNICLKTAIYSCHSEL